MSDSGSYSDWGTPEAREPDAAIEWIVGKCHVGQSNLSVVRHVLARVKGGRRGFFRLPKPIRRRIIEDAIEAHRANGRLYAFVMGGNRYGKH